ncbi:uncharacterized protein CDV56_100574 [Aspergillus thermomutatus]|uniref:Uncharacterized protein n=1 Tax=Aspergillus thermomutatus TaxID=41047 RepID=A0A397FYV7_ASPTH|nr:uncharacterized protein CDV56_100574 [Aspergillus thermomutatus]RHZ43952.1 hypothetical protein CDV56_100574 [Aspergillus thermomutatus]
MSSQSGNAWAQMKAREQKQQQEAVNTDTVAIPRKGPVMGHRPTNSRKSSGLDFDADLALPMPKPRHVPAEDNGDPVEACKPEVVGKPNITKKRSVTEPARPEDVFDNNKGDNNKSQKEKMKSRVAALRSKLSLKDLAKEFRRDSSKNEPAAGNEDGQIPGVETHDFSEEKLYVPKPREPGVYPSSAPPFPFRDISFGQFSQASVESCAVASSIGNDEQPNNEKLSLGPFAGGNGMQSPVEPESERKMQLDALLLSGSSPAARTGEFENSGQAQVIREQSSIRSLRAENEVGSPASTKISFYAVEEEYADPISPSIYDNASAEMTNTAPDLPTTKHRHRPAVVRTNEHRFPVMLSTDQPRSLPFNHGHGGVQPTVMPAAPVYQPALAHSHTQHFNAQTHATAGQQHFAGVTSHGGYAPPPPHPGYRNTTSLEQQLASHTEAVHLHINTALHRFCRVLENSNNWSNDQILRQTDAMSDVLRMINTRSAGQNEIISDLHRGMTSLECQVGAIEMQIKRMEERLLIGISNQINRLRGEINASIRSPQKTYASCNSAQDPKTTSAELQAAQNTPVVTKDSEKRQDRKGQRFVKKGPAQNIPSTTVAFRSTPLKGEKRREFTESQVRRRNPAQESSGSPEPKVFKLSRQTAANSVPENGQSSLIQTSQNLEIDDKPTNEGVKTPHKKGMFGFRRRDDGESHAGNRFLRTPRRNKKTKNSQEQNGYSSTPPVPAAAAGASQPSSLADESPSSIHPALRNDRQQQIMLDRERLKSQPRTQTGQATPGTERPTTQRRGFRNSHSHSHQHIGTRTPTANHLPANAFAVTPSSSSSLHRDIQLRPPAVVLPPRAPPMRPRFPSPHGGPPGAAYAGRTPQNLPASLQVAGPVPVTASAPMGTQGWQAATWHHSGASPEGNQSNPHA